MKYVISFLFFLFSCTVSAFADDNNQEYTSPSPEYYIDSFSKAKKLLLKLYSDHQTTFYCNCQFDQLKRVDADDCGYIPRKNAKRGNRIEWEHVVPAHRFGSHLACWSEQESFPRCIKKNGKTLSGRRCCRKVNPNFKEMEADMMNLVPAVGELNADRSNYAFGVVEGEFRLYGQCDFEVNTRQKITEPEATLRGDIARTYLYFENKYGLVLTEAEKTRFDQWKVDDPINEWELEKAKRVNQVLLSVGKRRSNLPIFVETD